MFRERAPNAVAPMRRSNEDAGKNKLAASVMNGENVWLEQGRLDFGLGPDAFKTRALTQPVAPEPELKRAVPS